MLSRTQGSTTIDYGYENSQWGDLLTSYRGRKIAYEGQRYDMATNSVTGTQISGNPVNYCGSDAKRWEMTWKNGKYLAEIKSGARIATYEYDKNGLRTSKTYNDTRYDYAYAGDKLVWQGWEGNEMYFFYDNTGAPIAFWYFPDGGSRVTGYYFTNQQGDVVRIEDPDGNVLASYSYDAWGKAYKSSGSMRNINPLRFRGYYYDTETGFYYLQSRYYDPVVSRFINADSYASTGQGFLGYNMFAYCGNDPVSRVDASGSMHVRIDDFGGGGKAGSFFGAGARVTAKQNWVEHSWLTDDPLVQAILPVSVVSGEYTKEDLPEIGDSSRPVSLYAEGRSDNWLLSNAGIKMGNETVNVKVNLALDDISIPVTTKFGKTNTSSTSGLRIDLTKLQIGFEQSTTTSKNGFNITNYTYYSISGNSLLLLAQLLGGGDMSFVGSSALRPAYN